MITDFETRKTARMVMITPEGTVIVFWICYFN